MLVQVRLYGRVKLWEGGGWEGKTKSGLKVKISKKKIVQRLMTSQTPISSDCKNFFLRKIRVLKATTTHCRDIHPLDCRESSNQWWPKCWGNREDFRAWRAFRWCSRTSASSSSVPWPAGSGSDLQWRVGELRHEKINHVKWLSGISTLRRSSCERKRGNYKEEKVTSTTTRKIACKIEN